MDGFLCIADADALEKIRQKIIGSMDHLKLVVDYYKRTQTFNYFAR